MFQLTHSFSARFRIALSVLALQAIEAQDKAWLCASADELVFICEGCHAAFKPDTPTEGILPVLHYEYGESLVPE